MHHLATCFHSQARTNTFRNTHALYFSLRRASSKCAMPRISKTTLSLPRLFLKLTHSSAIYPCKTLTLLLVSAEHLQDVLRFVFQKLPRVSHDSETHRHPDHVAFRPSALHGQHQFSR